MKKITDERLILQNLKNVRILYSIQLFGMACILGYEFFRGGFESVRSNPLWILFILIAVVSLSLQMNTVLDYENEKKKLKRSFLLSIIMIVIMVYNFFDGIRSTPNYNWKNSLLISAVILICGLIPAVYGYYLRKKRVKDLEEEE